MDPAAPNEARLLVVDDDPRSRKLLEGFLEAEGYRVSAERDGQQALAAVAAETPDLVLLDVMMPGMSGYEVCSAIKSDPRTRLCQVMLVTALDGTPDKVAGLDTGADDYVTKPVRRDEFLAKVRALLRARRLVVDLEQARAELAARNRELEMKKMLAQSLVHDLKSPLASILGNLELLELRGPSNLTPTIQRCKQGTARMLKMVFDLLDVESLEEGRLLPASQPVDAADVAAAAVEEAEVPARQASIRLRVEDDARAAAQADPALLRRVLDNLLANAIAHSPSGGTVTVRVSEREEGIEVAVLDDGPGVPEELRERVFEKYARLDARVGMSGANHGLGLTFCRLAVEAHGGTIWVETAPGGGACFRALFPSALEGATPLPAARVAP